MPLSVTASIASVKFSYTSSLDMMKFGTIISNDSSKIYVLKSWSFITPTV